MTNLGFMEATQDLTYKDEDLIVSRCGYTGEDGFEISIGNNVVESFMNRLWKVQEADGT